MAFRTLVVLALLAFHGPMEARAADQTVRLTDEGRAHLEALRPLAGRQLAEGSLTGKTVVVTFFASWCPPCHTEFRHLNALYENYADKGVEIVAINRFEQVGRFTDDGQRLTRFLARYDPSFSVVKGDERVAELMGDVTRIPTVLVFAPDGSATLHFIHIKDSEKMNPTADEVETAVQAAVATG